MDVSGDPSFPAGYWETFREVVKATKPSALTVSETWQKDSTLLRMLRGDRLDTTMNYRFRDAVIAFLAPGAFDGKGFGDSGHVIPPSDFLDRLASIREDYPDAAYYSAMNLLDSHDTERLLWTLTPGAETRAAREQDAANVAAGKQRVRLASLIQFTIPARRRSTTATRSASPATTIPTTGGPTRGPTSAARPTPRCSRTTRRSRPSARPARPAHGRLPTSASR
jgi:hypothetical protein